MIAHLDQAEHRTAGQHICTPKEACGGNRGGGPQDSKDGARGQKPA